MQSRYHDLLPSEHRLLRLQSWLGGLLAWAAVHVIGAVAPALVAAWLNQQRRRATVVLVARALKRFVVPGARRAVFHRHIQHRVTIRRMAGAAFRRALKARTLEGQLRAIQRALADAERWIAAFLRRFSQRFTRLMRLIHALEQIKATRAGAGASFAADSS